MKFFSSVFFTFTIKQSLKISCFIWMKSRITFKEIISDCLSSHFGSFIRCSISKVSALGINCGFFFPQITQILANLKRKKIMNN